MALSLPRLSFRAASPVAAAHAAALHAALDGDLGYTLPEEYLLAAGSTCVRARGRRVVWCVCERGWKGGEGKRGLLG